MRVAAIDQGTTSTRTVVVDETGPRVVFSARHAQHLAGGGIVEHDPEELLANVRAAIEAAGPVDAIGIANQGESCLGWDAATGRPMSPVIVWQDSRTTAETEALKAAGAEAETLARAGLPLDPYFSASKLARILRDSPEAQALRRAGRLRLGTTDAFFLDRLLGRFVTDVTTASRTSLMNLAARTWDPALCALFGVPPETLPAIVPTTGAFGAIETAGLAVPLRASVVDQQAALYGHGCRTPGSLKITFGTGAFALAVTGDAPLSPGHGLLPTVAWAFEGEAATYALDGGVYNAGSAIDWAQRVGIIRDHAELDAVGPMALDDGIAFVPALSGLACPHWDRAAAGLFIGLSLETTRADMARAVVEGVALRAAEVVEAMAAEVPIADPVSIDGGLAANRHLRQVLADALGRTVVYLDQPELTALGCAAMASPAGDLPSGFPTPPGGGAQPGRKDGRAMLARFGEAVDRSKSWRIGPDPSVATDERGQH